MSVHHYLRHSVRKAQDSKVSTISFIFLKSPDTQQTRLWYFTTNTKQKKNKGKLRKTIYLLLEESEYIGVLLNPSRHYQKHKTRT